MEGIQPRISGFRVEGTASSPPSTTKKQIIIWRQRIFKVKLTIIHGCHRTEAVEQSTTRKRPQTEILEHRPLILPVDEMTR